MLTRDEAPPEEEAPPATEAGAIVVWCGTLGVEVSSTSPSLMPDGVLTTTGVCWDGDEEIAAAVRIIVEVGVGAGFVGAASNDESMSPTRSLSTVERSLSVRMCSDPTEKFRRVRHRDGW